jgi:alkanesulfonate monooxygenase SsuD/methylene tetrahydromethanopterin reductase-like flavin-dependent oxidoreductase (luciferase family)
VRYCDGWIPIDVLVADLPEALADLHRKAVAAGRSPASLSVSLFAFEGTESDTLRRYRDLGVTRVVLVAPRRLADALPFLDRMARVIPDIT